MHVSPHRVVSVDRLGYRVSRWLQRQALRALALLAAACALSGCAYEVIWAGGEAPRYRPPAEPIGIPIAVTLQSFEAKFVRDVGVMDRFVSDLRGSKLFAGVLYPIPADLDPLWKMRLLVRETFDDPTSNLYKAAFARMFFPAAFFLYSEEEYTLDVEVLITRRDELIGSYTARGPIRYRYQLNAPELEREAEGLELILARVDEEIFAKISADAERILAEDRARAGK